MRTVRGCVVVSTEPNNEIDDEDVCGETYDHTLKLIDEVGEADGYGAYECTECGAEIVTEPDEDES